MKLLNKKTGEIADLSVGFIKDTYGGEFIQIKPVAVSNKDGYFYGSLAELNEDWEDYAPQEPLIKDKKIRKVVRAWADVLNVRKVYIKSIGSSLCIVPLGDETYEDQFKVELPYTHHLGGFYYTITELCGDEDNA